MPFGLCNAVATFERLMETVLRGLIYDSCLVYMDVILIGRTWKVFKRFQDAYLKLNLEKCQL
jgi:hypothetical protein